MHRRLRLARRELASLRSEKTIVLALLIQLFVAAFSSFLVVGLVSLYDPGATQGGYTVDVAVSGPASDELVAAVDDGRSRRAVTFEDRAAALSAFDAGRVDAVLYGTVGPAGRIAVEAIAPDGSFRTTLVVVQLKGALSELERTKRRGMDSRLERRPLSVPDAPKSNPYFGFTYTVLVPMLAFLPAFISGSIASDSLAEEIERGTLELLRVTPLSLQAIVDGKALAMVAIAPAQAGLWLLFLAANGTAIAHPAIILVMVAALAGILVVIGAGLAIAIGVRREAQLLYSLIALALFGLAVLLPENPPNLVAKAAIGSVTPTTYASVGLLTVAAVVGYAFVRQFLATKTVQS